ncbi:MAG: FAD-dependent oxidoreductase [Deltaproteobacteria bacterium]|nr:FAD-dependent oxidoreductase [Deltaproteobacteria bacterium]
MELGKDITVEKLREEGYGAIFMGIGAHLCKTMGIEGEGLTGVFSGIDFLRDVNLGKSILLKDRIAVIGGGNVAMDAARSAKRLGAKDTFVIYRRGRDEMPANAEEIEECEEEGIRVMTLTNPVRILGENDKVTAIECVKMRLGEPDASGRRKPLPIEGSEFRMDVDGVIQAIGQESDWSCLGPECACNLTGWGTIYVDPLTLQTEDPDLFAGGDAVTGPKTVIEAIEAGKQAAISIDRFIQRQDLRQGREETLKAVEDIPIQDYKPTPREQMPRLLPDQRVANFNEVQLGFTEEQAVEEAERCLACGICSECFQCVDACKAGAVTLATHAQQPETLELEVGAVILAPGFKPFDPAPYSAYEYGKSPDIVTSMEFERILSASGPTMGHLIRPSDKKEPEKIAWIQCVGSRDLHSSAHRYCSSVCCMYAIKEAVIAKEHTGHELDCAIFYMDMRTHGKDFERYLNEAKERHGVRFIRSRVPTVEVIHGHDRLVIPYIDENGIPKKETFDMVVLSVGLETSPEVIKQAQDLGIELTEGSFCQTESFNPVTTSRKGIYTCGAFRGPADIPQSLIEAGSAAAEAGAFLTTARGTLTREKVVPEERAVAGEVPRIGVFVCQCGINISGVVNVPAVRDYAASLPYVSYVGDNLYTCSQDTQEAMTRLIREKGLNRIVVAACTPKTHEPLFQETLTKAGLNRYLFEMTNIRNQDSWVHKDDPHEATEKAKDLVRMAVAKVALMEPLQEARLDINQKALVIGGGVAGMTAARNLSTQGFKVYLVERSSTLGGQARRLFRTWKGENVQANLAEMIQSIQEDDRIEVRIRTELSHVDGFVGNFRTTVRSQEHEEVIEHGVAVIATGAREAMPEEYLYGQDPRILTHLELDERFMDDDSSLKKIQSAVFIQCVGSREPHRPYCSRVCCTHAIESAIHLKEINPDMKIYILYRDIRTYGEREYLYRKAREEGVLFIHYSLDTKPEVFQDNGTLRVRVMDAILGENVVIRADLLTLASAVVPYKDETLARMFKIPMNEDGFFVEAHAKLGPAEFATDGVFLCGMAHYPKSIDEAAAQALAASSRAVTLLARKTLNVSGTVAQVNPAVCSACGICIEICPYSAPSFRETGPFKGKADINPALCKGCGLCVASCRSGALNLHGFAEDQIMAMINEI